MGKNSLAVSNQRLANIFSSYSVLVTTSVTKPRVNSWNSVLLSIFTKKKQILIK